MNRITVCGLGLAALVSLEGTAFAAETRFNASINPVWRFHAGEQSSDAFGLGFDDSNWTLVSLPHSHDIFDGNMGAFSERGREIGWYRRNLQVPAEWLTKKMFIEFQGAMQTTELWVNGKWAGAHSVSGFDSFDFDITSFLKAGTNLLAVRVDNTPNRQIPPDGVEMDYILFGGIYRDVFLRVTDPVHLTFPWEAPQAGVRLTLPEVSDEQAVVRAAATVRNESRQSRTIVLVTEIRDREGNLVKRMDAEQQIAAGTESTFDVKSEPIADPHLWSPDDPYLYKVITIVREGDHELDREATSLGIRWVKFDKEKDSSSTENT